MEGSMIFETNRTAESVKAMGNEEVGEGRERGEMKGGGGGGRAPLFQKKEP